MIGKLCCNQICNRFQPFSLTEARLQTIRRLSYYTFRASTPKNGPREQSRSSRRITFAEALEFNYKEARESAESGFGEKACWYDETRTAYDSLDSQGASEYITMIQMRSVITRDPDILGGEPVFASTRVPVKSLFDHLEAGDSIGDFLEGFPSVKREQVLALLEESKAHVIAHS